MNPVQIIATLRKLGNYVAGLFPALVAIADWFGQRWKRLLDHPKVRPHRERLQKVPAFQGIYKVFERFYWRDYSKDRLDLAESPEQTSVVLRPVLQLCLLACVLIPFTQINIGTVQIETMSGLKHSAPAWSVWLWSIGLACAWSAVIIGTSLSNRVVFLVASSGCLYYMATCALYMQRSYWNAFLGVGVICALALSERALKTESLRSRVFGALTAVVTGIFCSVQIIAMTPLRDTALGIVHISKSNISVYAALVVGPVVGLLAYFWGRLPKDPQRMPLLRGEAVDIRSFTKVVFPCFLTYIISALLRGGLAVTGGLTLSSLTLSNSYLWPMWYFIGVGVVLKLMGHSRAVSKAISSGVKGDFLQPVMLAVLVVSLLVAFADVGLACFQQGTSRLEQSVFHLFYSIWQASKQSIWNVPLNVMTVHWFKWVLLVDAGLVVVLLATKRLTRETVVRITYLTCFAALLVWEYVFELSSFARSPSHSVITVFLFASWLLWLMHTVGWDISSKNSRLWPSAGRFAIYAGITLLCLLEIHGRTALDDWKVSNELFMSLFQGILYFGLPYFLYLYATTNRKLPVQAGSLFGSYVIGACLALALNAADKFATANCSWTQLHQLIRAQATALLNTGNINLDLVLPEWWLATRAILFVGTLFVLHAISHRRAGKDHPQLVSAIMTLACASGVASFSIGLVELPLSSEMRALTAPMTQELTLNANVFCTYIGYLLPAALVSIVPLYSASRNRLNWLFTFIVSTVLCWAIFMSYQDNEIWLRETGLLTPLLMLPTVICLILLCQLTHELDLWQPAVTKETTVALLPFETLQRVLVTTTIAIAFFSVAKAASFPLKVTTVPALDTSVTIAPRWEIEPAGRTASPNQPDVFSAQEDDGNHSLIAAGYVKSDPTGTLSLLKKLMMRAATSGEYPNLTILTIENWGRRTGKPGAIACYFSYELSATTDPMPMSGLTVLVPRSDNRTAYFTLFTNPTDLECNQWQLAQFVQTAY